MRPAQNRSRVRPITCAMLSRGPQTWTKPSISRSSSWPPLRCVSFQTAPTVVRVIAEPWAPYQLRVPNARVRS